MNFQDLLTRLQHHNSTVRQEAVRELKDILSQHSTEILSSQLRSLLQGIAALSLDREKDIRRDSLKVLNSILGPISNEQLCPFSDVLISYLRCSMTHIDPNIKEDSLLFLDVLAQNCGALLAKNARKVLPNFLDMISKLRAESQPGRQLVTALNSKNTSVKWRTKVLTRLSSILSSIVSERKSRKLEHRHALSKTIIIDSDSYNLPIYNSNNLNLCHVDFDEMENPSNGTESDSDLEELTRYTKVLMPLMLDSWLEVMPKEHLTIAASDRVISSEASYLLKSISEVIQLIIEYFELLEAENGSGNSGVWLHEHFLQSLGRNLLDNFPYSQIKNVQKSRKRQEDFERVELNDKCLEQNLSLCYAYMWILTSKKGHRIEDLWNKEMCSRVLDYINGNVLKRLH